MAQDNPDRSEEETFNLKVAEGDARRIINDVTWACYGCGGGTITVADALERLKDSFTDSKDTAFSYIEQCVTKPATNTLQHMSKLNMTFADYTTRLLDQNKSVLSVLYRSGINQPLPPTLDAVMQQRQEELDQLDTLDKCAEALSFADTIIGPSQRDYGFIGQREKPRYEGDHSLYQHVVPIIQVRGCLTALGDLQQKQLAKWQQQMPHVKLPRYPFLSKPDQLTNYNFEPMKKYRTCEKRDYLDYTCHNMGLINVH